MSEESHETVGEIVSNARDKYTVHECNECTRRKCCELRFDSAECREEREDIFLLLGIEDGYFSDLLNRIEAAWKRDEEGAVEHATRHADAVARDNCRDCVHNPKGENYEGGNAAAMYEALVKIAHYCDDIYEMDDPCCADGHILSDMARAALSKPPRKGKWKNGTKYEYEYAYCSECGRMQWAGWDTHKQAKENIESFAHYYKFCPGCGAEMEGGVYVQ